MKEQMPDYETVQRADGRLCDAKRLLEALNLLLDDNSEGDVEPHKGVALAALQAVEEASEMLIPTKPKVAA
jgi:hypothetical protein